MLVRWSEVNFSDHGAGKPVGIHEHIGRRPIAALGNSMQGFTAIYYSFTTLTTVGYDDIVPVSGAARMLAMTEAMTGTLYMAVLIARLVSLYSAG